MMIIGKSINKKGQTTRLEYSNGNIEEFYYDKDGNNSYPVTNFTAISGGNESLGNAFVQKSGDTMTGNLKVPNLNVANDICRGYIYGETNSLNFRGGNPTTGRYTYLKIAEDGVYIDN